MQSRIPTYIFSLFIPLALVIGCFGFYNRVEPRILGFPFIYAWIFACFFLVSPACASGWLLDPSPTGTRNGFLFSRTEGECIMTALVFIALMAFSVVLAFMAETRRLPFDG